MISARPTRVIGNHVPDPVLASPAPSAPPRSPDVPSSNPPVDPSVAASSVGHGSLGVEVVVDAGSVVVVVVDDVEVGGSATLVVG